MACDYDQTLCKLRSLSVKGGGARVKAADQEGAAPVPKNSFTRVKKPDDSGWVS
jgi:hypothetical protein